MCKWFYIPNPIMPTPNPPKPTHLTPLLREQWQAASSKKRKLRQRQKRCKQCTKMIAWFSNPTLPTSTSTSSSSLAPLTSPPNRSFSLLFSISVWLPRKRWKVKPKPRKDKRKTFETKSKDHTFCFTQISCANFFPLQSHRLKKKNTYVQISFNIFHSTL